MKLSISKEAQKGQGDHGGTYFLQEDKINNKAYWIHQSDGKAIWWDKDVEKWNVGSIKDLGSDIAGIKGPFDNDSPPNQLNQITNGWRYWNGDKWLYTNDVHFEDWTFKEGKFLHSLFNTFLNAEFKRMSHFYDFIFFKVLTFPFLY